MIHFWKPLWWTFCAGALREVSLFDCASRHVVSALHVLCVVSDSAVVCYRGVGGGRWAGHHAGPGQHGHGSAGQILDLYLRRHVFLRQLRGNHRHVQDHLHDDVPLVCGPLSGIGSRDCRQSWIAVWSTVFMLNCQIREFHLSHLSSWIVIMTQTPFCCWFLGMSE